MQVTYHSEHSGTKNSIAAFGLTNLKNHTSENSATGRGYNGSDVELIIDRSQLRMSSYISLSARVRKIEKMP